MAQTATNEYGQFRVESESRSGLSSRRDWYVVQRFGDESRRYVEGDATQARTLAATLSAADADTFDLLPPHFGPSEYDPSNEWEEWSARTMAVPVEVAAAGKAAVAGYLNVVHRKRPSWIALRLGVSEQTVQQYLSDLRQGRR